MGSPRAKWRLGNGNVYRMYSNLTARWVGSYDYHAPSGHVEWHFATSDKANRPSPRTLRRLAAELRGRK